jgi:hypothetical protein
MMIGSGRIRRWLPWQHDIERYLVPYIAVDGNYLTAFFGITGFSFTDINNALEDTPKILRGEMPCTRDVYFVTSFLPDLALPWTLKLIDLIDYDAVKNLAWSLYNSRWIEGNYIETIDYVQRKLNESLLSGQPAALELTKSELEKLINHYENNLIWPKKCIEGIYSAPTPDTIFDHFENVKNGVLYDLPVSSRDKTIVLRGFEADIESLEYTWVVFGSWGPLNRVKSILRERLTAIIEAAIEKVQSLPLA